MDIKYFIKNTLSETSHANTMHRISQYCNYKKLSYNPDEVNRNIKDILLELKNGLKKPLFNNKELNDSAAISLIYRLAFYLSCFVSS